MTIPKGTHDAIVQRLADDGKLIEAGWIALRYVAIPADAPETQLNEMRKAFFAGAQHLWASVMGILEAGEEATAKDIARMSQINDELESWKEEMEHAEFESDRPAQAN